MKSILVLLLILFFAITPAFSQNSLNSNDMIVKMKTDLDLQEDQVTNITPIIEKYSIAFGDLQKSIDDGTINSSSIDSQRQGIEASETQELSQYLKPNQSSQWRQLQSQMDQQKPQDNLDSSVDADKYSNLPNR